MRKGLKITLKILAIIVLIVAVLGGIIFFRIMNNMLVKMTAVVVKVHENSLSVMELNGGLMSVEFADEGNIGFKQGQEIAIYSNGMVLQTYPAQLGRVGKIKIIKEKSETPIPEKVLKFYYSSRDNVNINVSELTNRGIKLTITDTNQLTYKYSKEYRLSKRVKNKDYTGIGYKLGEDTPNSTAGYTGTGLEYMWEEMEKISDIPSKDTSVISIYQSQNMVSNKPTTYTNIEFDWTTLYGELKERRI